MSLIKADTVAPSAGGKARSLSRGVAAAWCNVNVSTGAPVILDSENTSGVTDYGVGVVGFIFANAMATARYSLAASTNRPGGDGDGMVATIQYFAFPGAPDASKFGINLRERPAGSLVDPHWVTALVHGSLAP